MALEFLLLIIRAARELLNHISFGSFPCSLPKRVSLQEVTGTVVALEKDIIQPALRGNRG